MLEALQSGNVTQEELLTKDIDPAIGILLRYGKAVSDGAAKENLRLLAQVIVGMKRSKAFEEDKFRRWCGVLEDLTRDEILLIGKAIRIIKSKTDSTQKIDHDKNFWNDLRISMKDGGYQDGEIESICASVSRTGLILPHSGWGGLAYKPAPALSELDDLADLDSLT